MITTGEPTVGASVLRSGPTAAVDLQIHTREFVRPGGG
jgi:hypothetical protein